MKTPYLVLPTTFKILSYKQENSKRVKNTVEMSHNHVHIWKQLSMENIQFEKLVDLQFREHQRALIIQTNVAESLVIIF